MGLTHFSGVSVGDDGIEMTGSGTLTVPSIATAPSSPTVGDTYYDTTLKRFRVYQDSGWTTVDGTAAGSIDAAYNGGATATVDAGAVTLTDTQTTTGGGLLITKSGKVTSTHAASVLHINSTGAHDTSGALKMLEISVGSETASGGVYGVEVGMNAHADYAFTATKGSVVVTDGDFTVSGCGASTSNGFSVTTANTSGDAILFDLDTITSGDAFVINCTTDAVNYLAVQTDDSNIWTINGTTVTSQLPNLIDCDNAAAFRVQEDAAAATVFNVDTTQDAGDTTVSVDSKTTSGYALHVESDTTTGAALRIDADAVTTGDAFQISIASGTMGATGAAISVTDSDSADAEVFVVRKDGTIVMTGSSEGTGVFTITSGDVTLSDGDFTMAGGELSVTDGVTTAGSGILLTSSMTTAGAAAGAAGALTIAADSATTGTILAISAEAITTGDMLYLDQSASDTLTAGSGFYINCNRNNTSDFTVSKYGATTIAGSAAGTASLTQTLGDLVISDTDATTITSANGTGDIVTIANTAGVTGAGNAMLVVTSTGTIADGAFYVDITSGANGAASTASYLLHVDAAHTQIEAIHVDAGTSKFDEAVYTASAVAGVPALTVTPGADMAEARATNGALFIDNTLNDGCGLNVYSNKAGTTGSLVMLTMNHGSGDTYLLDLDNNGSADAVYIDNAGASNAIEVNQDGATGNAVATDGAIHIENTGNPGIGLSVYSNAAASTGTLVAINAANASFDTAVLTVDNASTASTVDTMTVTSAATSNALTINQDGAVGTAVATDGALHIENTGNTGIAMSVYSNLGATAVAELVSISSANAAFDQEVVYISATTDGSVSPVYVTSDSVLATADKAVVEIVHDAVSTDADTAVVRIEQTNAAGVSHVMSLKQDDIDKTYINFDGATAADYSSPISTEQGDGAVEGPKKFSAEAGWLWIGMVRCAVNGTKAYIPYYEEDPN